MRACVCVGGRQRSGGTGGEWSGVQAQAEEPRHPVWHSICHWRCALKSSQSDEPCRWLQRLRDEGAQLRRRPTEPPKAPTHRTAALVPSEPGGGAAEWPETQGPAQPGWPAWWCLREGQLWLVTEVSIAAACRAALSPPLPMGAPSLTQQSIEAGAQGGACKRSQQRHARHDLSQALQRGSAG